MMSAFHVEGHPRVQEIPRVSQTTISSGQRALVTQAGFRQFEWLVKVKLLGSTTGSFQVGVIQNVKEFRSKATYISGGSDPKPRTVTFELSPLPMLDSKSPGSAWSRGNFSVLGTTTFAGPLPPGLTSSSTTSEASISDGDDPGGTLELVSTKDPTKRLSRIEEHFQFVSWVAVRSASAPPVLASFKFLRHVVWSITRDITVYQDEGGLMSAPILTNRNKIENVNDGQGRFTPVVTGPIANQSLKVTHSPP
jgi:hypothetical protein